MTTADKQQTFDWIEKNRQHLSDWHQIIWHLAGICHHAARRGLGGSAL